jgi:hypothetical protein
VVLPVLLLPPQPPPIGPESTIKAGAESSREIKEK